MSFDQLFSCFLTRACVCVCLSKPPAVLVNKHHAAAANIFVAAAAGNSGPEPATVDNIPPWVTTVAASYQARCVWVPGPRYCRPPEAQMHCSAHWCSTLVCSLLFAQHVSAFRAVLPRSTLRLHPHRKITSTVTFANGKSIEGHTNPDHTHIGPAPLIWAGDAAAAGVSAEEAAGCEYGVLDPLLTSGAIVVSSLSV